ncbi:unnamed protein product [Durusdinium trenchii]|uniref:Uncharacterized protein n=1 Tax=Durusdinium trenchii TaxID=1381693 RepID=A0ABP0NSV7_9DINO
MDQVWQCKFVKSECHDPLETSSLFATSTGWGKLGPTASERCQAAMQNPVPGINYFMTLAPMISYRFHLVGHCPEGLTLCRFRTDLAAGVRCIAKPLNKATSQISVDVVPDVFSSHCTVHFYSMGGDEKLVIRNKTIMSRWGPVLKDAAKQMGRTNLEYRYIKFITMEGVEIKDNYHYWKLGDDLRRSVQQASKMVRSKFSKK